MGGKGNAIGARGEKQRHLVLFGVVPVTCDAIEWLCTNGIEGERFQILGFRKSPLVAHAFHESRHAGESLVAFFDPPAHLEAEMVVLVGIRKIVQTVVRLDVSGISLRNLCEIEGSSRVLRILLQIGKEEITIESPPLHLRGHVAALEPRNKPTKWIGRGE